MAAPPPAFVATAAVAPFPRPRVAQNPATPLVPLPPNTTTVGAARKRAREVEDMEKMGTATTSDLGAFVEEEYRVVAAAAPAAAAPAWFLPAIQAAIAPAIQAAIAPIQAAIMPIQATLTSIQAQVRNVRIRERNRGFTTATAITWPVAEQGPNVGNAPAFPLLQIITFGDVQKASVPNLSMLGAHYQEPAFNQGSVADRRGALLNFLLP
eukprot:PhM_4_TR16160/c3_g1_i2/m.24534